MLHTFQQHKCVTHLGVCYTRVLHSVFFCCAPSDQQQQPQILEGVLEMVRASDAVAAGRAAVRAVSLEPSQSKAERKRKAPLPALHPETQGATAAASALMGLKPS